MVSLDTPCRDPRAPDISVDLDALAQPAFLACFDAKGAVAAFRANAMHVQVFGVLAEDARRRWLTEQAGSMFIASGGSVDHEEQHPSAASSFHWWRLSLFPLLRRLGRPGEVFGLFTDVTRARAALCDLESAAYEDGLTLLGNRRAFDRDLAAASGGSKPFALLVFDIDRFKPINDRHGHAAGDDVLRRVALFLRQGLRREDRIYRIGGDEFAALVFTEGESMPARVAERLRISFQTILCPDESPVSVSIGGAKWRPGTGAGELFAVADRAMYAAKHGRCSNGRNA